MKAEAIVELIESRNKEKLNSSEVYCQPSPLTGLAMKPLSGI